MFVYQCGAKIAEQMRNNVYLSCYWTWEIGENRETGPNKKMFSNLCFKNGWFWVMTFLEFVYIMFLKGCLRAAKGYCFWCITLCFVLLQSCVCLGKLYFIPEKLFFIYKAIGMSGCLTHIHCMEHCKHVSWFVFSKYVFCKCIPCAF